MTHLAYPESRSASLRPFGTGSPILAEARALVRLAVPIMLIALVNMGMSVTDSLMVAHAFGAEGLAAVAVGSDFYSILFYLGAGIVAGISPFYTAALTQADPGERARLERVGLLLVALCGIVLAPLVWTAPDWLSVLGVEAALLDAGRGYTRAMAFTLLVMLGVTLYRTVLTAAERPGVFLKVTLAMLPLNALGNAVFMHGIGPVPAFGPAGAGISSLLVACASLGLLVVVSRRFVSRGEPVRGIQVGTLGPVLRVGIPIGIATLGEVGVFLGATIYIATSGAADVAAHTLTLRLAGVAYALPVALLHAAMVRSARAEAKDDTARRRATTQAVIGVSVVSGLLVMGALLVAAQVLPGTVFGDGSVAQEAAQLSVVLLTMLGVMELLAVPGSAIAGLLRGRKNARVPMLASLMGY
nr:MATE family efflux transporter [Desulfobacterales bacterium]